MKKKKQSTGFLLWTAVFAVFILLTDQILVRVPLPASGLKEIQVFYRDFRSRLLALPQTAGKPAASPAQSPPPVVRPTPPPAALSSPLPSRPVPVAKSAPAVKPPERQTASVNRYVYADNDGNLQFAESLDEVPAKLRREAKRLDD